MPNKNNSSLLISSLALVLASVIGPGLSMAAEIGAQFRAAYINTDNIFLQPEDEVNDYIWSAGMSLTLKENTSRMSADVRGIIDYMNYDQSYDSETIGGLDALIVFTLLDERLTWTIQDNYGQRMFDPLDNPTPGNRENVNFFTTGPNLQIAMGSRYFFDVEGRYSTVRYEVSPDDNDRVSVLLRLGRRISSEAAISLNVEKENVKFTDETLFDDFDINEVFVTYKVLSTRNIINIDLGYTELDLGHSALDGYLLRADWNRISSQTYGFVFSGGTEYSTQGDIFRFSQSNGRPIGGIADVDGNDTPFRNHFAYARYNLNKARTRIVIELDWNQEDYEFITPTEPGLPNEAADRDITGVGFSIERDLTRLIYVGFTLNLETRKYKSIDREDDDIRVSVTLGYRFSEALNMYASYLYYDRESDDIFNNFTENRGVLGIAYIPSWGR